MSSFTVSGDLIHLTTPHAPPPLAAHVRQVGTFAVLVSLHRQPQFSSHRRPMPMPSRVFSTSSASSRVVPLGKPLITAGRAGTRDLTRNQRSSHQAAPFVGLCGEEKRFDSLVDASTHRNVPRASWEVLRNVVDVLVAHQPAQNGRGLAIFGLLLLVSVQVLVLVVLRLPRLELFPRLGYASFT